MVDDVRLREVYQVGRRRIWLINIHKGHRLSDIEYGSDLNFGGNFEDITPFCCIRSMVILPVADQKHHLGEGILKFSKLMRFFSLKHPIIFQNFPFMRGGGNSNIFQINPFLILLSCSDI